MGFCDSHRSPCFLVHVGNILRMACRYITAGITASCISVYSIVSHSHPRLGFKFEQSQALPTRLVASTIGHKLSFGNAEFFSLADGAL